MFKFSNRVRFMYDGEPAAGTGQPAPAPPAQDGGGGHVPPDSGTFKRGQKPSNVKDFLGKAKVMNQADPGAGEDPQTPNPEPAEGKQAEKDKQPLVRGPGQQQPDQSTGGQQPAGDGPIQGEPTDGQTLKIGDLEYSQEQWIRFAKDYENDMTWKANNTKRSQVISKFSDEELNLLAPYALGQKELPKDFKDTLAKELPDLKIEDEDGYETSISPDKIPEDFMNALKLKLASELFPQYFQLKDEHGKLKAENDQIRQEIDQERLEEGTQSAIDFMNSNPDFAITLYSGEQLHKTLAGIVQAGPDHPEYHNAKRIGVILQGISSGMFRTYEEARDTIFQGARRTPSQKVAENQAQGSPERPGSSPATPTGGKALLDRMSNRGKGAKYGQIRKF